MDPYETIKQAMIEARRERLDLFNGTPESIRDTDSAFIAENESLRGRITGLRIALLAFGPEIPGLTCLLDPYAIAEM